MEILPSLRAGSLTVVYAEHAARDEISHVISQLALRGPVAVLDGGNRFQAYRVAQLLRQHTTEVHSAAGRLFIRRAFTCYQMLALLEDTPALPGPYLILDLLRTFYDENVRPHEAVRLLEACLGQVERLCSSSPVAVTLGRPILEERAFLIQKVCDRAESLFTEDLPAPGASQPELF